MIMRYIVFILILFSSGVTLTAQDIEYYFSVAAENNPGLKAKYLEYEAAMQRVPQVSTLPDPTFSFGYFISSVEKGPNQQIAQLSLSQMFPWFGTLKAKGNTVALLAEAKFQNFINERNRLYYSVATAYYSLYEQQKWVEIEKSNLEILQSYLTIADANYSNGKSSMVDLLRINIEIKEAQTRLDILRNKERPMLAVFNQLLNRKLDEIVVIKDTLTARVLHLKHREDFLVEDNPLIKSLDISIMAEEAEEKVAELARLPQLGVGLDYVVVRKRSDMMMPMLSVTIPLFMKKYNAAVKESQLLQESYTLQKEDTGRLLEVEYEEAWFNINEQLKYVELYNEQIQLYEQSLNLLLKAYANSGSDFEEVLRMQQDFIKLKKARVTALSNYQIALSRLNYITAKSFSGSDEKN